MELTVGIFGQFQAATSQGMTVSGGIPDLKL